MDKPAEKKSRFNGSGSKEELKSALLYDSLYIHKYSLPKYKGESINAVKISKDNTKIATCSSTGVIRVYDFDNGVILATLKGHTKGVSEIAFSPIDSDILASGSDDLTIRLWSVSQRKCIRILKKHTYHITTVIFNSKGNILVSGSADETIILWDLTSGNSLKTLAAHSDPVSSVCLTPDDTLIVSSSYDGLMRIFDTETGQCLKTLIYNSTSHGTATASTSDVVNFPISNVTVSPNGKFILSSSLDGKIRLWDYMSNKVVKTFLGPDGTACINHKYSSGSAFIYRVSTPIVTAGSDTHGCLFWDLQSKAIVYQLKPGKTILDVSSQDEGLHLAMCSLCGEADVYELNKEYLDSTFENRKVNGHARSGTKQLLARKLDGSSSIRSDTETPMRSPESTPHDYQDEIPAKSPSQSREGSPETEET